MDRPRVVDDEARGFEGVEAPEAGTLPQPTPSDADERGYRPIHPGWGLRDVLRKLFAPLIAAGFLVVKYGGLLLKFKVFGTAASMLVSIAAYTWIWGLPFAVGFVVLILVHELGHVAELRRQGVPASAPFFIPFIGAAVAMKQLPDDAWKEARVALAGPIIGSLGAAAVWAVAEASGSQLLLALAFVGFFINLLNLIPILPLDGGRAVVALHPAIWLLGLAMMVGLLIVAPNPLLILIVVIGALEFWRRRHERRDRPEYYRLGPGQRLTVAAVYIGLIVVLSLAATATHVERDL
jgi:Zn-dependent protease